MPSLDVTYVLDMLNAARLAQTFVSGVDKTAFMQDLMRQSAVLRQLEVMGEAAKHVSPSFKAAYPDIPWRQIAGMRDILIHAYNRVDLEIVWTATQVSIPQVIPHLETLISALTNDNS
jgi:uncharacterized protein with HEPN domain